MKKFVCMTAFAAIVAMASTANAQESVDSSTLGFGVGIWDVFERDDTATDFRVEYRHGTPLFWKIKPWGGAELTSDASVWAGGGVLADFKPADNIYITPSFGVGLYTQGSNDKDLDFPIEFRTQIEGGYQFINGHRVGVALSHISNAHLGDDNPGTDILNVYYHVPVGSLF